VREIPLKLDRVAEVGLEARWQGAMGQYVDFLVQQDSLDSQLSATLTLLELRYGITAA